MFSSAFPLSFPCTWEARGWFRDNVDTTSSCIPDYGTETLFLLRLGFRNNRKMDMILDLKCNKKWNLRRMVEGKNDLEFRLSGLLRLDDVWWEYCTWTIREQAVNDSKSGEYWEHFFGRRITFKSVSEYSAVHETLGHVMWMIAALNSCSQCLEKCALISS